MSLEQIFSLCSIVAMLAWLLLIIAPRWRVTERLVISGIWSLSLSLVYFVLIVIHFPGAEGGFGTLDEVATLFSNRNLLLAGWVHYLAFDLLVGALEVRQSKAAGIPHLLLIPVLVLTFMLGPIGLVVFFIIKSVRQKKVAEVTA